GLVGFPNAGKSTLLSALTQRRAEIAAYAFTTLNPQVGTVRVLEGGDYDGGGEEVFRFTIADNPGLIAKASENVGLGHGFLRSIERASALAYVVDLSGERPWDELSVLRGELESYKEGLSAKCRLVVANKADLLGAHQEVQEETAVQEARMKLTFLEAWVHDNLGPLDVVPVSAKYSQNLRRVVRLLSTYVLESRKTQLGG
ncbi:P-loop containing nucleoside triphosphate hydrolase protein, partial [Ramaria rubella]